MSSGILVDEGTWTMCGEVGSPGTTSKFTCSGISGSHTQGVAADRGIAGCRELETHPMPRTDVGSVNMDESYVLHRQRSSETLSAVPAGGTSAS